MDEQIGGLLNRRQYLRHLRGNQCPTGMAYNPSDPMWRYPTLWLVAAAIFLGLLLMYFRHIW
jgi:hypothetical protein